MNTSEYCDQREGENIEGWLDATSLSDLKNQASYLSGGTFTIKSFLKSRVSAIVPDVFDPSIPASVREGMSGSTAHTEYIPPIFFGVVSISVS